jgi:hypothetical protein
MNLLAYNNKIKSLIKDNSNLEFAFINAIKNREYYNLKSFLAENGTYFNCSKIVFLAKLERILSKFEFCTCSHQFTYDIAHNPGQKVHQLVFYKASSQEEVNSYKIISDTTVFQLNHPKEIGKIPLVFTMSIENGKIQSISTSKKFITKREFRRLKKFN